MACNSDSGESSRVAEGDLTDPGPAKKTKLAGTFRYSTSFSAEWRKTWAFVSAVPGNPNCFRCNVGNKKLSCAHQGVSDVKDHVATQGHQKLAKTLVTQPKLSFPSADPLRDNVSYFIYITSHV